MAVQTLERLINGNENIIEYYRNARELWEEIRNSVHFESVVSIAEHLTMMQMAIEHLVSVLLYNNRTQSKLLLNNGLGIYHLDLVVFIPPIESENRFWSEVNWLKDYCNHTRTIHSSLFFKKLELNRNLQKETMNTMKLH